MSKLADMWRIAANDLGLDIVCPFLVKMNNGASVKAEVLVKNVGASNGMLIIFKYDSVSQYVDELLQRGYGFSVMGEPFENEPYERESFIELLHEWGVELRVL